MTLSFDFDAAKKSKKIAGKEKDSGNHDIM